MLKPKLFSIIKHRDTELRKKQLIKDIVSGLIVAIVALPLSIALAIASGVSPEKGLITAIFAGFFISLLGGSRVQIGGPTGAFVIIVYGIVANHGIEGLTIATIMAGLFMILFGVIGIGSIIQYVPYPVTTGFTAGIAVGIFSTQINDFFGLAISSVPAEFFAKWQTYFSHFSQIDPPTLMIALLALVILILWPRVNKTIPGSFIALVITTIIVTVFRIPVDTIGSRFGSISGTIQFVDFSNFRLTSDTLASLIHPALTIAFLASIESLLSAVVADGMIGKKHNSNMELIAQGVANIASAVFGGIPATGAIARTAVNIKNGGRTPIAGIVHSLVLLLIMLLFMPLAQMIPMPALAAILIIVAYNMSEWRSFVKIFKSSKSDIAVLMTTFILTVLFDLVISIEIGMIIALLLFVKRIAENTEFIKTEGISQSLTEKQDSDIALTSDEDIRTRIDSQLFIYEINGPLFFGTSNRFIDIMSEINYQKSILILKMKNVPSIDATALNSLRRIEERARENHLKIIYAELRPQPMRILTNSGFVATVGQECFKDSIEEAILYANKQLKDMGD